jgi:DNA end-binding protein Ku
MVKQPRLFQQTSIRNNTVAGRSVANIIVSFGMYNIGMKLYLTASPEKVSFNMLNPKTNNRVKQQLVDAVTGEFVDRNDTVKGFEYSKNNFVTFTDEEINNISSNKKNTIDIKEFVPLNTIDFLNIEKSFYSGPDKGMDRPYTVLYRALSSTKSAAVGIWISNGKEHLVVIRPYKHGLLMHQMFYETEIRSFDNMCAKMRISSVELELSTMLIERTRNDEFDIKKYRDTFIDKVKRVADKKIKGTEITAIQSNTASGMTIEKMKAKLISLGLTKKEIEQRLSAVIDDNNDTTVEKPAKAVRKNKKAAAN